MNNEVEVIDADKTSNHAAMHSVYGHGAVGQWRNL